MIFSIQTHRRRFLLPLGSVCALCVGLAGPALGQDNEGGDDQENQVDVTDYGRVDIAVQNAELAQVLQMLSLESRKNIVTGNDVSATVSCNLFDVTFYEALDAILTVNGYGYEERGNFIYVMTAEELEANKLASMQPEHRIFELFNMAAEDAALLIAGVLSETGTVQHVGGVSPGIVPDTSDVGANSYSYMEKLVVTDYPENLEKVAMLLEELDTEPMQVLVEATILQTAISEANAFGVDFSAIGSINFTDLTNPLSAVNNLLAGSGPLGFQPDGRGSGVASTPGATRGPGTLKVGIVGDDMSVFLKLLDEVTDSTVLARPRVMALNRQRAEVLIGERVGYLSTTATETTTTQTVEFLDTGIHLVFRPFINKSGMIRLELHPSVSEASLRTVTDSNGIAVTIPDELTNELTTNVRVRDGQTVVLGGLYKESTQVSRRQVPLLGDIPVIGNLFRGQDDTVGRDEIIFLITPTILHDEVLWENGEEMLAYTEMIRIGARQGLLGFSRERLTANHNQSALDAREAGDVELALHHIRNSLRLNSNQPQLRDLMQELSGEDEKLFERSLLQRVLHKEMEQSSSLNAPSSGFEAAPETFTTDPLVDFDPAADSDAGATTEADALTDAESDADASDETEATSEFDAPAEEVATATDDIADAGDSDESPSFDEAEAVSFSLDDADGGDEFASEDEADALAEADEAEAEASGEAEAFTEDEAPAEELATASDDIADASDETTSEDEEEAFDFFTFNSPQFGFGWWFMPQYWTPAETGQETAEADAEETPLEESEFGDAEEAVEVVEVDSDDS